MILDSNENAPDEIDVKDESDEEDETPLNYRLVVYPADFTLEVLIQKWKNGDIAIPTFQRGFVWTIKQASRLVESVMLGLPIPPIFLCEENSKLLVIDGRQRLHTLASFSTGSFCQSPKDGKSSRFKLTGINTRSSLCGREYQNFTDVESSTFNNYVLRTMIIKPLDPENDRTSVYHIFERLNTGGTALQDQEIRNCIYEGSLNTLLKELNEYPQWRTILGKPYPDKRQKDVQLILRYMSLYYNSESYKKPMRDFLSDFMSRYKNPSNEFLDEEKNRFKKTCDTIVSTIGEKPFHRTRAINAALLDAVFVAFAKNLDCDTDNVKERFERLRHDEGFQLLISDATTDAETVRNRLILAENKLFG